MLKNPRHEKFAQALASGMAYGAAYTSVGYKKDDANARKLSRKPNVVARVAELQDKSASKAVVNLETMTEQLFADRQFARLLGNPSAAVKATVSLCQIHGLLKHVVDHGGQINVVNKLSDMDAVRRIAFAFALAEQQREKTIEGHVDAPDVG